MLDLPAATRPQEAVTLPLSQQVLSMYRTLLIPITAASTVMLNRDGLHMIDRVSKDYGLSLTDWRRCFSMVATLRGLAFHRKAVFLRHLLSCEEGSVSAPLVVRILEGEYSTWDRPSVTNPPAPKVISGCAPTDWLSPIPGVNDAPTARSLVNAMKRSTQGTKALRWLEWRILSVAPAAAAERYILCQEAPHLALHAHDLAQAGKAPYPHPDLEVYL